MFVLSHNNHQLFILNKIKPKYSHCDIKLTVKNILLYCPFLAPQSIGPNLPIACPIVNILVFACNTKNLKSIYIFTKFYIASLLYVFNQFATNYSLINFVVDGIFSFNKEKRSSEFSWSQSIFFLPVVVSG